MRFLLLICCFCLASYAQQPDAPSATKNEAEAKKAISAITPNPTNGQTLNNGEIAKAEPVVKYYTLVEKTLQPDKDEFYVNTIYKVQGKPKALIARSLNQRASEVFNTFVEYGIGDNLAEDFVIEEINFLKKEILIKQISLNKIFKLKMGYGDARSSLIPVKETAKN